MFERIATLALNNRLYLSIALLVGFVAATAGVAFLQVDLSFQAFFGKSDPANHAYAEFREHWGADDDLILVVVQANGADLLEPDRARAIETAALAVEALPEVRTVTWAGALPSVLGDAPGLMDMEPMVDLLPKQAGPEWEVWRERMLANRLAVPGLIAPDGATAAMMVETRYESGDVSAIVPIVQAVQAELDAQASASDLQFGLAGVPAVRAAFFDQFMKDQMLFTPVAMVFISGCLFLVFRRIHGILIPGLAAFLPVVMVFGFMGWTGEPIGLLSQTFTTLLPAIAVADAIHMVSRYHEALRAQGGDTRPPTAAERRAAIHLATSRIGAACLLTSITTGIGFFSLRVAEMPILRSFGTYAGLGIFLAYLGVLLFVPMMLTTTRGQVPTAGRVDQPTAMDRALLACADFSLTRPWIVMAATAVVLAVSIWCGRMVVVDNSLTRSLESSHPVTAANQTADQQLGGIIGLEVDLKGTEDALKQPEVLRALLDFESWAIQREEVRQVTSPATWVALLHQATTGEYRAPDSPEAAAQFFLLAEGDQNFSSMIDGDYARARMLLQLKDEGGLVFTANSDAIAAQLQQSLQGLDLTAEVTGTPFVAYRGINGVTHDLRDSLMLAFVLIAAIITLLFRDLRTGLLCLIPNALPLVVGYGVLGLMGWLLDPTPAVIFTVALGIAVDDTLHLLIRYREELSEGRAKDQAIRLAVLHSGRAVTITSVILVFGFGINALSSFNATQTLGYLGATVITTALLSDVFVLPAMLKLWARETV